MILYDCHNAPSPYRVRMFMAEKDISMDIKQVTIMKGEHFSPEYRKISPNARVPVLQLDDGTVLQETVSICRYLEALYPEPNLMGMDALEVAKIDARQRQMEFELLMPFAMAFRHAHPAMAALEKQSADYAEICKETATKRLKVLEKELAGKDYLVSDRFTIADITAYTVLRYFPAIARIPVPDALENVHAYMARISARPSASVYDNEKPA